MTCMKRSMGLWVVLVAAALLQVSMAAVYKVGDSAGWTIMGNIDYKKWANSKTFRVGDVIVFSYSSQFHNVVQVKQSDYDSCSSTAPIKTYTTGNDSITITSSGSFYYLCGVPGHCQAGQKVAIQVVPEGSTTAPAASPSLSPKSPPKNGAVYKVGDSAGWTIMGNIDYKKWANSKTFRVGDVIVFSYSSQFHNVVQVKQSDYDSCSSTAPIKTYTTGNDSITLTSSGSFYYLCGVPGHCQAGQKVAIQVAREGSTTAPAASPSLSPKLPPKHGATTPKSSPAPETSPSLPLPPSGATPLVVPAPAASPKSATTIPSVGVLGKLVFVFSIFAAFGL